MFVRVVFYRHGDIDHGKNQEYEGLNARYEHSKNLDGNGKNPWDKPKEDPENCMVSKHISHQTNR